MIKIIFMFLVMVISETGASEHIAIIGAGAAGLAAAERLQSEGFLVTIFEKEQRIGGKCFSMACKNGDGIVDLGAIQVGLGYPIVSNYVKQTGLSLRDYWPSWSLREGGDGPVFRTLSEEYWPMADALTITQEVFIMHQALQRFAEIELSNFDQIPHDSEFLQPFETWADSLGLYHFKEDYRLWITSYGYGLLDKIPAYLALSLINSSLGLVMLRGFNMNLRMVAQGYGGLMHAMVDHYQLNVKTGVNIDRIRRTPDGVDIIFDQAHHHEMPMHFDQVVVACGFQCVRELFKDELTQAEKMLLNDLVFSPYDVVIADVPKLPKGGYVLAQNLTGYGHVSLISKNSSGGDETILYIPREGVEINRHIPRPSERELENIVKDDLNRFGFSVNKIIKTQYWDNYFPHFAQADSYHLLNEIQGKNHTLFVGSMARFEIVEKAMSHAHDMVQQHIVKKPIEKTSTLESFVGVLYQYFTSLKKEDLQIVSSSALKK